jgi:hypothetical protein
MFIVPTYKRPERLKNLIQAYLNTKATAPVYVLIQGNAELYDGIEYPDIWTVEVLDKNLGLVAGLNYVYQKFPNEKWYGIICDDQMPITEGWDQTLLNLLTDWNMVSTDDTLNKNDWRMAGIPVFGGEFIRFCGFIAPPCTWHICCDDWWELVGKTCSNWIKSDAQSTHMTPETTGIAPDETYKTSYVDFDGQVFQYKQWLEVHGNQLLDRIKAHFKEVYEPQR